jgi:hypothetical protein
LEVELLLAPPNRNPTVSSVPDQTLFGSTVLGPIEFTVGDGQTAPSLLKVVATSDNPSVVLNQNILLGGGRGKTKSIHYWNQRFWNFREYCDPSHRRKRRDRSDPFFSDEFFRAFHRD